MAKVRRSGIIWVPEETVGLKLYIEGLLVNFFSESKLWTENGQPLATIVAQRVHLLNVLEDKKLIDIRKHSKSKSQEIKESKEKAEGAKYT